MLSLSRIQRIVPMRQGAVHPSGPFGELAVVDPLGTLGQLGTGALGDLNTNSAMHPGVPFSLRIR